MAGGDGRLFVMTLPQPEGREVIGFYALNAHMVTYHDRPGQFHRSRPGHGSIPAASISMIGRDRRYRSRGIGAMLLADALKRIAAASARIGIAVVLLDVLNCGDPARVAARLALYQGYGFQPLASSPHKLWLPVATLNRLLTGPGSDNPARIG